MSLLSSRQARLAIAVVIASGSIVGAAIFGIAGGGRGIKALGYGDSDPYSCTNGSVESTRTLRYWAFRARVSPSDGLEVTSARFGVRSLVRSMSAPYFEVSYKTAGSPGVLVKKKGELTRNSLPAHAGVAAAPFVRWVNCTPTEASAEYEMQGLPTGTSLTITQTYEFLREAGRNCEPTRSIDCARFWPSLGWAFTPGPGVTFENFRSIQRFDFIPDGNQIGRHGVFRDLSGNWERFTNHQDDPAKAMTGNVESQFRAIRSGNRTDAWAGCNANARKSEGDLNTNKLACTWDNYHQSARDHVATPHSTFLRNAPTVVLGFLKPSGKAGCPECIHIHWGWDPDVNKMSSGFTRPDGKPQILEASRQDAYGAVAVYRTSEVDPVVRGYESLLSNREALDGKTTHPVFFWDVRSGRSGLTDTTFPRLSSVTTPGGGFVAPAWTGRPGVLDIVPVTALARRTGSGWALPVVVQVSDAACRSNRGALGTYKAFTAQIPTPAYLRVDGGPQLRNPDASFAQPRLPGAIPFLRHGAVKPVKLRCKYDPGRPAIPSIKLKGRPERYQRNAPLVFNLVLASDPRGNLPRFDLSVAPTM
jgi:hypothetical protein